MVCAPRSGGFLGGLDADATSQAGVPFGGRCCVERRHGLRQFGMLSAGVPAVL